MLSRCISAAFRFPFAKDRCPLFSESVGKMGRRARNNRFPTRAGYKPGPTGVKINIIQPLYFYPQILKDRANAHVGRVMFFMTRQTMPINGTVLSDRALRDPTYNSGTSLQNLCAKACQNCNIQCCAFFDAKTTTW
jgi:hypothetical protein